MASGAEGKRAKRRVCFRRGKKRGSSFSKILREKRGKFLFSLSACAVEKKESRNALHQTKNRKKREDFSVSEMIWKERKEKRRSNEKSLRLTQRRNKKRQKTGEASLPRDESPSAKKANKACMKGEGRRPFSPGRGRSPARNKKDQVFSESRRELFSIPFSREEDRVTGQTGERGGNTESRWPAEKRRGGGEKRFSLSIGREGKKKEPRDSPSVYLFLGTKGRPIFTKEMPSPIET